MQNKKHIIGVISGKGGVGKTTVAVNVASLLSLNGIPTVLIDGDLYNPSVGFHLGMWHQPTGLQHLLEGKAKPNEVISIYSQTGLRVVLSSLNFYRNVKTKNYPSLLDKLNYDYIVIDSSPGLSETVEDIIDVCNELYIVLTPDVPSVASAKKIVSIAKEKNVKMTFLLNRFNNNKYELHPKEIEETLASKISIIIPEDIWVPASISLRTPVVMAYPHSPSAKTFEKFMGYAAKLAETKGMPVVKNTGIIEWIKRLIGLK